MKQNSGFTLIEMTIVIVIASLILAAALAFVRPYFVQQQLAGLALVIGQRQQDRTGQGDRLRQHPSICRVSHGDLIGQRVRIQAQRKAPAIQQ